VVVERAVDGGDVGGRRTLAEAETPGKRAEAARALDFQ
jgi:hypothetical protein